MRCVLLCVLAACGGPSPSPPSNAGGSTPTKPDLANVQSILAPHSTVRLHDERGCIVEQSLGQYVAMLVQNGTGKPDSKDTHRLTGGCEEFPPADKLAPIDPPSDPAYWYCRIDAYTVDPAGESPWHYELRLRIRKADRAVDLTTLSCPGTP